MPPVTRSMRARDGVPLFDRTDYTGRRVRTKRKGIYEIEENARNAQETSNIRRLSPSADENRLPLRIRSVLEDKKQQTLDRQLATVNWDGLLTAQEVQRQQQRIRRQHATQNTLRLPDVRNPFLNNKSYQLLDVEIQRQMDGDTDSSESESDDSSDDGNDNNNDQSSGDEAPQPPALDVPHFILPVNANPPGDLLPSEKRMRQWRDNAMRMRRGVRPGFRLQGDEPTHSVDRPAPFWQYRMPDALYLAADVYANYSGCCGPITEALALDRSMQDAVRMNNWAAKPPMPWPSYNYEYDSLRLELPTCAFIHIAQWEVYDPDPELRMMYHLAFYFGINYKSIPRLIPREGWVPVSRMRGQPKRPLTRANVMWEFQYIDDHEQLVPDAEITEAYDRLLRDIRSEYHKWWHYSQRVDGNSLWTRPAEHHDREGRRIADTNLHASITIKRALRRLMGVLHTIQADAPPPNNDHPDFINDVGSDHDEEVLLAHEANNNNIGLRIETARQRAQAPRQAIFDNPQDQGRLTRVSRWWIRHARHQARREVMWARRSRTLINRRREQEDRERRRRGGGMFVPTPPVRDLDDVPGVTFRHRLSLE